MNLLNSFRMKAEVAEFELRVINTKTALHRQDIMLNHHPAAGAMQSVDQELVSYVFYALVVCLHWCHKKLLKVSEICCCCMT